MKESLCCRPGPVCLWLVCILIAGVAGPALSAENSSVSLREHQARQSLPLTLEAAVEEALANNPALRTARARVDERRGQRRHAGRLLPSNPRLEVARLNRDGPVEDTDDLDLRISQELWIGGQGGLAEDSADARLQAAQAALQYLEMAVSARTRQAFLLLLWASESVDTAQRMVEINQQLAEYTQQRQQAGVSTAMEVNTAQIGLQRARAALEQARNRVAQQRLTLADLLARDAAAPLQVRGELAPWTLELPDETQLLNRAVAQRSDLVEAARQVEAARHDLTLSQRQWIPNLTVFGVHAEEEGATINGAGVSFELPVFHQYGGETDAARARLEQQRIAEDALRLQVRREVLSGLADYRAAASRVQLLGENTLQQAEDNVRLLQQALQAGEVGAPAVTSAQNNLIQVRDSYLAALREQVDATAMLERATGGLVTVVPDTTTAQ
ncbi:MAG: TolC family protein [Pseudohongiellaceae bacterium]